MNNFWTSEAGLAVGSLGILTIGLMFGGGFFYYAATGLIWGFTWARMANDGDYQ